MDGRAAVAWLSRALFFQLIVLVIGVQAEPMLSSRFSFENGGNAYGVIYCIVALANTLHFSNVLGPRVCIALASTSLVIPYMILELNWRAIGAIGSLYYVSRVCEIANFPAKFKDAGLLNRLLHVQGSFHHLHTWKPANSRAACLGHMIRIVISVIMIIIGQQMIASTFRVLGFALHTLGSLQAFGSGLSFLFLAVGLIELPELMDAPYLSTSLREFWGARWNTVVQQSLTYHVYRPLRTRGTPRGLCVLATFGVSGLIHAYPMWVAGLPLAGCIQVESYFIVQAMLVLLELLVGSPEMLSLQTLWVSLGVLVPLPLLVNPILNFFAGELR